jgi:hypothetical protein
MSEDLCRLEVHPKMDACIILNLTVQHVNVPYLNARFSVGV